MFKNLKDLWKVLSSDEKIKLSKVTFLQFISGLFDLFGVLSVLPFLTVAVQPEILNNNDHISPFIEKFNFSYSEILYLLGSLTFFIILLNIGIKLFVNWYSSKVSHSIWQTLTKRMFNFFLSQNYDYYLLNNSFKLLEKLSNQVNAAQAGFIEPLYHLIGYIFTVIFVIFGLIILNPYVSTIAITVIGIFYIIFFGFIKRKIFSFGKTEPDTYSKLYKLYGDAFGSIKEIKLLHNKNFYVNIFNPLSIRHINAQVKKRLITEVPRGIIEIFSIGGIILLSLILLYFSKDFKNTIPILAVFAFSFKKIIPAMQGIYQSAVDIQFHRPAFESVKNELILAYNKENKISNFKKK